MWLKPLARIFKNMRSRMVDVGLIKAGLAPSYFVEGLLYNVPNEKLRSNYQSCVANTLNVPEDRRFPNLRILSIAGLLSKAIKYNHEYQSVSSLFPE